MSNPWQELHTLGESAYTDDEYTDSMAREVVANEYRDTDQCATECPCGGTLHYKATIGALKCPDCGQLADINGDLFD